MIPPLLNDGVRVLVYAGDQVREATIATRALLIAAGVRSQQLAANHTHPPPRPFSSAGFHLQLVGQQTLGGRHAVARRCSLGSSAG